jgi:hypothetical protein
MSNYWNQQEAKHKELWVAWEEFLPFSWIERSEYWHTFESEYRPNNRYTVVESSFIMPLDELRLRIKQPPIFRPFEEDFPGPVERWYGKIEMDLFTLTHYYGNQGVDHNVIVCENDIVSKKLNEEFEIFKVNNPYEPRT